MAFVIADRVRETTSTTGTGTITLAGPYTGFQAFSVIGNGNTTYYAIIDATTGAWEVGIGTYTTSGNTLSRTTVLASSNADALVNFSAGVKDVICTQPAERTVLVQTGGTGLVAGAAAFTANGVPYADSTSTLATSSNLTFNGTRLTVADFADSSLTSGRVTYATTGGNLTDSANLTFNGTTLTLTGLNNTGNTTLGDAAGDTLTINGTAVSTPNGLNFDSNTLVIDATNNRVGINESAPACTLAVDGVVGSQFYSNYGGNGLDDSFGRKFNWTLANSGSSGATWRKIAVITLPDAAFSSVSLQIVTINPGSNYGAYNLQETRWINQAAITRRDGGAVINTGFAYGAANSTRLRLHQNSIGEWELQANAGGDNQAVMYEVTLLTSGGGAYVTPIEGISVGTTGGTVVQFDGTRAFAENTSSLTTYGGVVVNEGGGDNDFRVESVGNTNMLFVDASTNRVGIAQSSPGYELHVGAQQAIGGTAGTIDRFAIQPYSNTGGPYIFKARTVNGASDFLDLYYGSALITSFGLNQKVGFNYSTPTNVLHAGVPSPATLAGSSDGLVITTTSGTGYNTQLVRLGASYSYSGATGRAGDGGAMLYNYGGRFFFVGDGASASDFVFTTYGANRLQIGSDTYAMVVNEDGLDYDFRVESDASTHMLFVDAGDNSVNINTNTPLGGKLNVVGSIYTDSNHKVHIPLPAFNFGAGGITDEYWVVARRYVGSLIAASGLSGTITGSRGSAGTGNVLSRQNINILSAYNVNSVISLDSLGNEANFVAIDIISISGVEYYALRGRPSGGECDNGLYFDGMMINNTGDTKVFTRVRSSDAGVSVVTTNVGLVNSWFTGDTYLEARRAGYSRFLMNGTETVVNEDSVDYDFRVESDTNTHMLFVDAGSNAVGIDCSTPQVRLQIGNQQGSGSNANFPGFIQINDNGGGGLNGSGGLEFKTATAGSGYGWKITSYDSFSSGVHFSIGNRASSATWTQQFTLNQSGFCQIPFVYTYTTGSAANVFVDSAGTLYRSTSSLKYKKNVQDYTRGLADLLKLRPVFYEGTGPNDDGRQYAGLISEEVEAAGMTEFVDYGADGKPEGLYYQHMVALLVKSITELKSEFDAYKASHP